MIETHLKGDLTYSHKNPSYEFKIPSGFGLLCTAAGMGDVAAAIVTSRQLQRESEGALLTCDAFIGPPSNGTRSFAIAVINTRQVSAFAPRAAAASHMLSVTRRQQQRGTRKKMLQRDRR